MATPQGDYSRGKSALRGLGHTQRNLIGYLGADKDMRAGRKTRPRLFSKRAASPACDHDVSKMRPYDDKKCDRWYTLIVNVEPSSALP